METFIVCVGLMFHMLGYSGDAHDKSFFSTQLVAGKYGLEVLVYDNKGNYGRDYVNITVRPSNTLSLYHLSLLF